MQCYRQYRGKVTPPIAANFPEIGGHSYRGINLGGTPIWGNTFSGDRHSELIEHASFCEHLASEGNMSIMMHSETFTAERCSFHILPSIPSLCEDQTITILRLMLHCHLRHNVIFSNWIVDPSATTSYRGTGSIWHLRIREGWYCASDPVISESATRVLRGVFVFRSPRATANFEKR